MSPYLPPVIGPSWPPGLPYHVMRDLDEMWGLPLAERRAEAARRVADWLRETLAEPHDGDEPEPEDDTDER